MDEKIRSGYRQFYLYPLIFTLIFTYLLRCAAMIGMVMFFII